ncbi:MAG: archease [candidate division WOR-3 bacterium]|nr:MAG: archease [candidate division WOR-3 bacterium]
MKKPYKYLDHTADLGIEIRGQNREDLFINVGRAIFETQITGAIRSSKERSIELTSDSLGDLIIEWCRELLYIFSVEGFIPKQYRIKIEGQSLQANLCGDEFDAKRHQVRIEIKNPTYHDFFLEEKKGKFKTRIIFDV